MALEELQASKQQARREVETASQFAKVPETLGALGAGEIPAAHATQIAKAASQGPVDESVLVEAARSEDFGKFSRTLRDHLHEQSGDDGKSLFAKQRERRTLSLFKSADDGMLVLSGRFDPVAGNRIEAALADELRRQKNGSDNNDGGAGDQAAFDQKMADALENLVCADASDRKPQGTTLILTADWDSLHHKLADARLIDGTPLPVSEALRLACNADIVPSVFNTKTQELWVGRKHRSATDAQRAALIVRDKNCVGCGRSAVWCEAHHIDEWAAGGPTDIDNLVLVCTSCHHQIHDEKWTVNQNPNSQYQLQPPPPGPYADFAPGRGCPAPPPGAPSAEHKPPPESPKSRRPPNTPPTARPAAPLPTPDDHPPRRQPTAPPRASSRPRPDDYPARRDGPTQRRTAPRPRADEYPEPFPDGETSTWQPPKTRQLLLN